MHNRSYETRHRRNDALPTHRHREAYAALVIDGSYVESSIDGSVECVPGSLVIHPAFHAHGDRFGGAGARVVNVVLDVTDWGDTARALCVADLREARRVLQRHPDRLADVLEIATSVPFLPHLCWHGEFLAALRDSDEPIGQICARVGVSAAHASRDLLRRYGMSPQALRRESRWRKAMRLLATQETLADIAAECGFADQSHLARTFRAVTGHPPSRLLRHIKYVQDRRRRGMSQ
jgi:AraC family transcriptional regulator